MKVQFHTLSLASTSRKITFKPGLNLIHGPISTGKTSVLRLLRIVLGASPEGLPSEIRLIPGVAADVTMADERYDIYRRLVTTPTAKVEISSGTRSYRLPVAQADATSRQTYASFLLDALGLPSLRVPRAPTQPDSDSTPVSANDYLQYCDLPKEEIRSQVFGHKNPFKDIKRKYAFEIFYGQYDVETARLQEQLREVRTDLRVLQLDDKTFDRLMDGTAWSNRAAIERELAELHDRRQEIRGREEGLADGGTRGAKVQALRKRLTQLDENAASKRYEIHREDSDIERFERLASQLESQIGRLTRAIVANETLLDIEFVVCPRCGTSVDQHRAVDPTCYLCLQEAKPAYSKNDMIAEQDRLSEQLEETQHLVDTRRSRLKAMQAEVGEVVAEREEVGAELDRRLASFISDSATELQDLAARRAETEEKIARLEDYLELYDKRDRISASLRTVQEEEAELLAKLDEAMTRREDVEQRIRLLEARFTEFLRAFALPDFLKSPAGKINRRTFLPLVNGRTFEELQSEGLSIEVNVAHALAHHSVALELDLPIPGLLLLDGVSGGFGDEGLDPKRVEAIYEQVAKLAEQAKDRLQIIAVDTTLPAAAKDHVALELSESDRLVPAEDLERLRAK